MKKRLHTEWTPNLPEQQETELVQRALRQKIDAEYREKWKQKLASQGIERNQEGKVINIKSRRRYLSIAAAIAGLLIAGWWFTRPATVNDSSQMADNFLQETARQIAQVRMGDESTELKPLWQSGRELYTQKKFKEAAAILESLAQSQSLSVEQSFLLAMSYIQSNPPNYDKALFQLSAAENANSAAQTDSYQEEIAWVKALVLYKNGEQQKANAALKNIVEKKGWYAKKATELMEAIRN